MAFERLLRGLVGRSVYVLSVVCLHAFIYQLHVFFYKKPVYKKLSIDLCDITIDYFVLLLINTIENKGNFKKLLVLGHELGFL